MLQKKYTRIILGALCVFLLLSLLSTFVGRADGGKREGFEGPYDQQDKVTPEDFVAFQKVVKRGIKAYMESIGFKPQEVVAQPTTLQVTTQQETQPQQQQVTPQQQQVTQQPTSNPFL